MAVEQIISFVFQFSWKKSLKIDREKSEKRSKNYETSETDFSGGFEKSTSTTSNYNYFVIFGELFLARLSNLSSPSCWKTGWWQARDMKKIKKANTVSDYYATEVECRTDWRLMTQMLILLRKEFQVTNVTFLNNILFASSRKEKALLVG